MYERGYDKVDVLELFRVIDWILRLPPALEQEFLKELYTYEEARQMPYITSAERFGIQIGREQGREEGLEQGLEQGIEQGLEQGIRRGEATLLLRLIELRFGAADQDVIQRIHEADSETLLRWSDRILTAQSLSDLLE
jgi:predicted transposase YdaD